MRPHGWPVALPAERVALTRARVRAVRAEIDGWLDDHAADERFVRFTGHFDVLRAVLTRMLDTVDTRLGDVELVDGIAHDRCRALETGLGRVRRIHRWYAERYDQRRDPRLAPVLAAADEVVRSCWTEAFAGRTAPSGPLAFLDSRFDALATPRVSVPSDLRAPGDAVLAALINELPVPVVALPALAVDEPWWLVLAAHETGHHVQHDLGLVATTRNAVDAATDGLWTGWAQEAFADAFSVVMVGTAASWAVFELQHGSAERLTQRPQPGDRYPPPVVRAAFLGEVARCLGLPDPGPGVADVRDVAGALREYLDVTAEAARVLAEPLLDMADAERLGSRVDMWRRAFVRGTPIVGRGERAAARFGIAGGVAAYLEDPACALRIAEELATCGPSGTLAEAPVRGLEETADRLAARVVEDL